MATSPIYSWPEPDNTDLVKNGALAIRTLGNAIDTTMGTMVAKTIIDAKGDLIVGTAADTASRLAVGNSGDSIVADSSTSTGLRYQGSIAAGRNFLINGGLDFWQRGTTYGGTGYGADRWYASVAGTTTVSQETSDLPSAIGVQYGLKYVTGAASSYAQFYQALETATVKPMRGQTVTASFYLKTAGSYSGNVNLQIDYSTSTDALTSQTTSVTTLSTLGSSATSWIRVQKSFTVPSDAVGLRFGIIPDTAQASGVTVRVTAMQLELGSVATTFSRAGGTIQGELAACQRYFERFDMGASYGFYIGYQQNTTAQRMTASIAPKRTTPTITVGGTGTLKILLTGGSEATVTAISTISYPANSNTITFLTNIASGGTGGDACTFYAGNAGNITIDYGAEL